MNEDVFLIGKAGFPASHVSLLEGIRFCFLDFFWVENKHTKKSNVTCLVASHVSHSFTNSTVY